MNQVYLHHLKLFTLITLCSIIFPFTVSSQGIVNTINNKIIELENLISQAEANSFDATKEKTTINTAKLFLKYANWDARNKNLNKTYFDRIPSFKNNSTNLANDLPNFERREVIKILDKAISNINGLISGEIKRARMPNINWARLKFQGDQLMNGGIPFFLNDYNFRTEDDNLSRTYGNMSGIYISPTHISESGQLAGYIRNNITGKSQATVGDVFLEHNNIPGWAKSKYSQNTGDRNFEAGKRSFVGFDIDNPGAKEMYKLLLDAVVPLLKNKTYSQMGISLCNEPSFFTQTDTWNTGNVSFYTKKKFSDWLIEKHGSVANVNRVWTSRTVNNVSDLRINLPINKNLQGKPIWYDWLTFNQKRVTDWFTFLHNRVKRGNSGIKTHIKNMPWLWVENQKDHGIDMEALTMLTDVIGNDLGSNNSNIFGNRKNWQDHYAFDWEELCMATDFFKSVSPNKPVFNTEVHYLSTVNFRDLKLKPEYARMTYWLSYLQGTNAGNSWVWGRNKDGSPKDYFINVAPKDYPGIVTQQPQILDEVTTTLIDLNSHSKDIAALQRLEKPIRIFYSKTSAINKRNHMDHMKEIYEELFFEGTPIGFATEKIINNQNNFGMKAIVVFNTKFVTKGELEALQKYLDNGGTIIKDNISLTHTEYNKPHSTRLRGSNGVIINAQGKSAQKIEAFKVVRDKRALPAIQVAETKLNGESLKTCVSKSYSKSGRNIISIVNIGKDASRISLKFNGNNNLRITNMINGKSVDNGFIIKSEEVLLLSVRVNGGGGPATPPASFVHIRKRNALGFALDGGGGGANDQNVKLWASNTNNQNQHWEEINRGNGFYSYKKRNTNFCLDGANGGARDQNVKLWPCDNSNQNQHWKKISTGDGHFILEKRNSPSFSIDGGNSGANNQNVKLWNSNRANQNQHWKFATINVSTKTLLDEESLKDAIIYPTLFTSNLNLSLSNTHSFNSMSLYGIDGKLLFSKMIDDSVGGDYLLPFSTLNLEPGVYFFKLLGKEERVRTFKLVKK